MNALKALLLSLLFLMPISILQANAATTHIQFSLPTNAQVVLKIRLVGGVGVIALAVNQLF